MFRKELQSALNQASQAIEQLKSEPNMLFIQEAAHLLAQTFAHGNKLIIAGNGGSLCDGAHFAEELTGLFRQRRRALPAISLSEPGHLSCVANDLGFEEVFSRGIEAFGKPGDLFVGLTTSGKSPNMVNAFKTAKSMQLATIAFLGKGGGDLWGVADCELLIDGFSTSDRIQEAHMTAIHIIIELMELELFSTAPPKELAWHTTSR